MLPNNGARSQERESSRSVSGPRGGGGHQGELLLTVRLDPYNMQDNCSGSGRGLGSEEQHRLQLQQPPTAAKGEKPELATHTHTQSRARATTNSARARFDSACCHTHTHLKQSSICTFFRAKSLHRWLNLEPSNRPKIQSGAKHRAIRTCSPPVSQESRTVEFKANVDLCDRK